MTKAEVNEALRNNSTIYVEEKNGDSLLCITIEKINSLIEELKSKLIVVV